LINIHSASVEFKINFRKVPGPLEDSIGRVTRQRVNILIGTGVTATAPEGAGSGVSMDEAQAAILLEQVRASLAERIATTADELDRLAAAAAGANTDDEHDPEGSTLAFERAQVIASLQRSRAQLVDVDDAVRRIASHCYGRCEHCDAPIDDERLSAVPTARRCIKCATG
jgi:RNA polymerase-binding transcription factor DksA